MMAQGLLAVDAFASARAKPTTSSSLRVRQRSRDSSLSGFATRGSSGRRERASASHLVVVAAAPNDINVSYGGGEFAKVPGTGGVVGSGGKADAVVKGDDVDAEHAKLEIRQGRIFVTALSRDKGTFLSGSRLFPGVAYAVAEGGVIVLGEGDGAVTMAVEQAGEVAGDAGLDMMANLMKMQFEATMSPEVKAALDDDD